MRLKRQQNHEVYHCGSFRSGVGNVFVDNRLGTRNIQVFDSNGRPFVTAKYYGVNDGPFGFDNNSSTWDLSSFDVDQLNLAVKHWVEIIQVTPGAAPAIFNIGTMDDYNAYAFSPIAFEREGAPTKVQAALTGQNPGDLINGAQGFIQIGTLPWTKVDYTPSQLPMTSEISLTATMIHEIGHALGVSSNFQGEEQDDGSALIYINETPNSWISHLYDDNGQKADQIKLSGVHFATILRLMMMTSP